MNVTVDPILGLRAELRSAASRRVASARRRRRLIALTVLVVAGVGTSLAIAANRLFGGPAPPSVVSNFKAYTPQLGFHPEPGKAVFVAQDGKIKLYATTNREGTYCLVVDEPWKPASANDGGVCGPKAEARKPITVGTLGGTAMSPDWSATYVLGGRVDASGAESLRFTDPQGVTVETPVGYGGFYVVAVHGRFRLEASRPDQKPQDCPQRDWEPVFEALDANGRVIVRSRILLARMQLCTVGFIGSPHG